jgi:enoyl-CoA hydratase/carnithine racemase
VAEVLVEQRDAVLIVTINRPDQRNAINAAVSKGVGEALDRLGGGFEIVLACDLAVAAFRDKRQPTWRGR